MSGPVIAAREFSFAFGPHLILKNISFQVEAGERLAVIGPNGAGKTTLVKCLNRLLTGGTGSISIAGRPVGDYASRELARTVSYVPQADGRSIPFSVREFVVLGRYPYWRAFSRGGLDDRRAVEEALALTGTAEFAERPVNTLSGGERQKVLIAAAIAQGGRIMLLDEPTTFLDPRRQAEVHAVLRRLHRERALTIVVVTHDVTSAIQESETILALKDGTVAFTGRAEELTAPGRLEGIYGVPFHILDPPGGGRPLAFPRGLP
jgi:iron complex transport system ATP-binding protein